MSTLKTLTVNGKTYNVAPIVPTASVTLRADGWAGNEGSYSQAVELAGVTSHTKVDLQPTPEQVEIFLAKTLAFVAENNNGVVTVYSIGDKPTNDYTIQVTMTEVEGVAPIRGNTVGLPNPQPDWNQEDSTKADYIKNKPSALGGGSVTHSWDGTVLTITSASGTSSADLKGDGVSVSKITESPQDGGINVVTFSDNTQLIVRNGLNGKDGKDGITPELSVTTGEELDGRKNVTVTISTTDPSSGLKLESSGTVTDGKDGLDATPVTPLFANSIEDCTDTTKPYVLPDGYIYTYMSKPTDNNILRKALGADGISIYNYEDTPGYKANTRWSQSGQSESTSSGNYLTGWIPVSPGDVIRLANMTTQSSNYTMFQCDSCGSTKASVNHNNTLNAGTYAGVTDDSGNIVQFTIPASATYKYIRIQCGGIGDTSIITINGEYVASFDSVWENTGHAFVPADYEGRILELEERADQNAGNITELANRVTQQEGNATALANRVELLENAETDADLDIPDYWQTALDNGAEAINTALCNAGRNKAAFLFYSDVHWNYGSQMSPTLLKYLYNHTGMNKTIFGGDIVNDEASDYDTMEYLWEWRKQLKDLPNHHSVPGNHDDGNSTNNLFSEQYVYGYLLAAEETPDIVRGDSGLYYYIDNPAERTRYLYLDTGYKDASALSDAQATFVKDSLKSAPAGWHIVVVAHIWYGLDYDQYDKRPVPIAGMSATASAVCAILDNYNSRSGEFSACGAKVEFCIGGHIHYDYDATTATGIPIILVETDSKHTRGSHIYSAGTTSEASVNGIIADYTNRRINVVRVGRGASRTVNY